MHLIYAQKFSCPPPPVCTTRLGCYPAMIDGNLESVYKKEKRKQKKKPPEGEFYSGEIIKPLQRETKIHLLQGRSVWELHRLLTTIHPHWNNFFFLIRYVRWRCGGLGKREGGNNTQSGGGGAQLFTIQASFDGTKGGKR